VSADGAATVLQRGGRLIADYGSFRLVEVDGALLSAISLGPSTQLRDEYNQIRLNAGSIDTATPHGAALRGVTLPPSGKRLHLVQFSGPIQPEWYAALQATGVQVVTYIPHNAYLVYGGAEPLGRLRTFVSSFHSVQWDGAYLDDYKLDPAVRWLDTWTYSIQLIGDPDANPATLELIDRLQAGGPRRTQEALGYVNVVARVSRQAIDQISLRPDVVSIQPYVEPLKLDERVGIILSGQLTGTSPGGPGYLAWLASKGFTQAQFTASGFAVDLSDSGIDNATLAPNHFGLYVNGDVLGGSRIIYNRLEGTPNPGSTLQGCDGHGTINAHIIGGFSSQVGGPFTDADGYAYGLGVAPFVKIGASVIFDSFAFTAPSFEDLQSRAYQDGARISSNGWGMAGNTYSSESQRYDALVRDAQPNGSTFAAPGNQGMVIVFSAGNGGSGAGTVGRPGTGKNVLTVGASENVRPFGGGFDQCGTGDASADSALDVAGFSSRGPTGDSRTKPDLLAPGTHVGGGVFQAAGQRASPPGDPLGRADGCFDGTRICGGDVSPFYPDGQEWYTASSGTSHAAPVAAGAAALLRQYFINQGMAPPSPAMTKAYLMGSARYMTGSGANDTLYSNSQGMGLLDLGMAFDGAPRLLVDEDPTSNLFTASGQTRTFSGRVDDPSKPFRVTLAWTDAPGSTTGAAYRNNLDLTVTVGGSTYLGNVFTGPSSVTGGAADLVNNVESVFLPAGVTGPFTVTVTATNINSDGVPNVGTATDQDFALVVYNRCADAPAAPTGLTASIPGSNEIELAWDPVAGATDYVIYRSLTTGGPFTPIGTATTPAYSDVGVSGGTTYHYVVRGRICAESGPSSEVSATATGACTRSPVFAGLERAANGTRSTCSTDLSWAAATPVCGGAVTYSVYRSQTAGFVPAPGNRIATGLTGTTFTDSLGLADRTTYHYVVRATEQSSATNEDLNTVERSASPTGTITTTVDYRDDFDGNRPPNASAYWIPMALSGPTGTLNLVSGCHFQSATTSYRFGAASTSCGGTYPGNVGALLSLGGDGTVTGINGFSIPVTPFEARMTFHLWYSFENRFDGAFLAYSTAGAAGPYDVVPDSVAFGQPYITEGGYDGPLDVGVRGWTGAQTGANGNLKAVTVDLRGVAGQTVWLGFAFATDNSVAAEGLYLDDVRVLANSAASCTARSPAVRFQVSGLAAEVEAGTPAAFDVVAVDALGQTDVGYTGMAAVASSDGQAVLPPGLSFTSGVASGVAVTFGTLGSQSITVSGVTDPSLTGNATTTVTAGPAVTYVLSGLPESAAAGSEVTFTVTARDSLGHTATGYSGTAAVASSDPAAVLPGDQVFAAGVASGIRTTFLTPGRHTVTVTDPARPALSATAAIDVTGFPPPTVAVTSPVDGDVLRGRFEIIAVGTVAPGTAITRLAVMVDGDVIGEGTTSPVTVPWGDHRSPSPSEHTITAAITDSAGSTIISSPVKITFQSAGCGCGAAGLDAGGVLALGAVYRLMRRKRRRAWFAGRQPA
jgi:hypothetical protein